MFRVWECGCRGIRITEDKISIFYDCRSEHDTPLTFDTDFSAGEALVGDKASQPMTANEIKELLERLNLLLRDSQDYRDLQSQAKGFIYSLLAFYKGEV